MTSIYPTLANLLLYKKCHVAVKTSELPMCLQKTNHSLLLFSQVKWIFSSFFFFFCYHLLIVSHMLGLSSHAVLRLILNVGAQRYALSLGEVWLETSSSVYSYPCLLKWLASFGSHLFHQLHTSEPLISSRISNIPRKLYFITATSDFS